MSDDDSVVPLAQLLERLARKTAIIGIIGMGYVGLPLMLRFSDAGFRTIGFGHRQATPSNPRSKRGYVQCTERAETRHQDCRTGRSSS